MIRAIQALHLFVIASFHFLLVTFPLQSSDLLERPSKICSPISFDNNAVFERLKKYAQKLPRPSFKSIEEELQVINITEDIFEAHQQFFHKVRVLSFMQCLNPNVEITEKQTVQVEWYIWLMTHYPCHNRYSHLLSEDEYSNMLNDYADLVEINLFFKPVKVIEQSTITMPIMLTGRLLKDQVIYKPALKATTRR